MSISCVFFVIKCASSLAFPFHSQPPVFSWKTEENKGLQYHAKCSQALTNYHEVLVGKCHDVPLFPCLQNSSFLLYAHCYKYHTVPAGTGCTTPYRPKKVHINIWYYTGQILVVPVCTTKYRTIPLFSIKYRLVYENLNKISNFCTLIFFLKFKMVRTWYTDM